MERSLDAAVSLLKRAARTLVFTGAGISTESGIPDFRGPDGLWSKVDPEDFTLWRYLEDPDIRRRGWRLHLDGELWGARSGFEPNRAHRAITDLWHLGLLTGVVTQNIDGLHQAAGMPVDRVAELHGNIRSVRCLGCRAEWRTEVVLEWVEAGDPDPSCPHCGGIVKTTTVLFGEVLPEDQWRLARVLASSADAILVVGSTLSVYPAADIVIDPARRGVPTVIVNLGSTDHDHLARVKLDGRAGDILPSLVEGLSPDG
jgi:NAD-dependent deacetylase